VWWGLITIYSGVFAHYLLHFLAAAALGAETYGFFTLGLTIITVGSTICQMGFNRGVIKLIGVYNATKETALLMGVVHGIFLTVAVFSLVVAAVGFFIVNSTVESTSQGGQEQLLYVLRLSVITIPFGALLLLSQNMARGFERIALANLPYNTLVPSILFLYILVVGGTGIYARQLLSIYAASAFVFLVVVYTYVNSLPETRRLRGTQKRFAFKKWFELALPLWAFSSLNQLLQRSDILILALFVPLRELGVYALASRISQAATIANRAFNRYWAPVMAKHHALNEGGSLRQVVTQTARHTFTFTLFVAIILVLIGQAIIALFGESYHGVYMLMIVLLVGRLVHAFFAPSIMLLQMTGRERHATKLLLIIGSVTVIAHILIIPIAGVFGAAVVTSSSMLTLAVASAGASKRLANCYTGAF
jgi:O-antigen/teichoic acid export membrane protein